MTVPVTCCGMRGRIDAQATMFAYVGLEQRVSQNHPMRRIKVCAETALAGMDRELTAIYEPMGRHSIPPEQLLKTTLLQIIYGIRSERPLVERIDDSMPFRWFLDLGLDGEVWVPTVYFHNRDRLLTTDAARQFLSAIVEQARQNGFVSNEHFSVDGTLLQAWASIKSYEKKPADSKDGNDSPTGAPPVDPSRKMRDCKGILMTGKALTVQTLRRRGPPEDSLIARISQIQNVSRTTLIRVGTALPRCIRFTPRSSRFRRYHRFKAKIPLACLPTDPPTPASDTEARPFRWP